MLLIKEGVYILVPVYCRMAEKKKLILPKPNQDILNAIELAKDVIMSRL